MSEPTAADPPPTASGAAPRARERPLVEIRNAAVSYRDPSGTRVEVAQDLNLTLARGEMAYLIGPTGSGKSSLLKLLYMDVMPEYGLVRVGPYQSDATKPADVPFLRRMLGVVFQDFQLLPDRSAYDNVAFALHATGVRGAEVRQRTMQALSQVGISHRAKARPSELSGGEQQRACVARAIVNDPLLLLADEPTGNLDPRVADEIQKLLIKLNRQGMALLDGDARLPPRPRLPRPHDRARQGPPRRGRPRIAVTRGRRTTDHGRRPLLAPEAMSQRRIPPSPLGEVSAERTEGVASQMPGHAPEASGRGDRERLHATPPAAGAAAPRGGRLAVLAAGALLAALALGGCAPDAADAPPEARRRNPRISSGTR